MEIKNQKHSDEYSLYNADCMDVLPQLGDACVDLAIYSPPFAGLFQYSSDPRDFSNCTTPEQFLEQYDYLVRELGRVTKPGRVNAVHCMDICDNSGYLWDFPHEIIKVHKAHGFDYRCRVTVWKEPLKVRMRTMVRTLMHKYIVEDSTKCFPAAPDYVMLFTSRGENRIPVTHTSGVNTYAGEIPILPHMLKAYNNANNTNFTGDELWEHLNRINDEKITKLNHYIWQRYASSVWDDIRVDNVVPFKDAKDEDDEKHVHPLQLDVIDRLVELYSNPGEIVLTPFMGVGSEVYGAVRKGRKGIGIELKDSYFKQAVLNIEEAARLRDDESEQMAMEMQ